MADAKTIARERESDAVLVLLRLYELDAQGDSLVEPAELETPDLPARRIQAALEYLLRYRYVVYAPTFTHLTPAGKRRAEDLSLEESRPAPHPEVRQVNYYGPVAVAQHGPRGTANVRQDDGASRRSDPDGTAE